MKKLDLESLSLELDWKQFEALARYAFENLGYGVESNYRLKRPRIEIDLLALKCSKGFAVDCKHWRKTVGGSAMRAIAEKQIARTRYALREEKLEQLVPMLVTLRDENLLILDKGVPVVPISKLSDFALNWEAHGEGILKIGKSGRYK